MFFSTYPSVAEGFRLKTWRGGRQAGQPKIAPTAKGLLERDLMRSDTGGRLPGCSLPTLNWPSFGP